MEITFRIKVEYRDKVYNSNLATVSDAKMKEIESIIEKVSKGETNFLSIQNDGEEYYFPEKVIQESIISIVKKEK